MKLHRRVGFHPRKGGNTQYTRFERARLIGARALQVSMGAPVLLEIPPGLVDPLRIAELEFERGVLPLTVKRETRRINIPLYR